MQITGIRTTLFACAPARSAGAPVSGCLLELLTDSDHAGIAIADIDLRRELAGLSARFLTGEDPRAAPAHWERMRRATRARGRVRAAMALLDVALWDLKAKAANEPLWQTLGGQRPRVNAVADCTIPPARLRRGGFHAGLLHAGSAAADETRLRRARGALAHDGYPAELGLVLPGKWSVARSMRHVRGIERRIDLSWVAFADAGPAPAGIRRLSQGVRAAVAIGRGLRFPEDFAAHFRAHSFDIARVDIALNGLSGALACADAAFGLELPAMLCAAPGNLQVQLAGALPYLMNAELAPALPAPFHSAVHEEDGRLLAGDRPGNGLELNRAALARCTVARLPRGSRRR